MAYVITEQCVETKDASCVEVCPVDCIHPMPDEDGFAEARQLFIDPSECIDCDACVSTCPVTAIYPEDDVPDDHRTAIRLNSEHFQNGR